MYFRTLLILILSITVAQAQVPAHEHGVIGLMYHKFNEAKHPSTNVNMADFRQQINAIKRKKYDFISVAELEDILSGKKMVNSKKVLLTVDDAWASFYRHAWPLLKSEKIPFVLFINTREINQGSRNYMTWQQIRELHNSGLAVIGHHSYSHDYLVNWDDDAIRIDLTRATEDFVRELQMAPKYFSYPFGEYSIEFKNIVKSMGFRLAFGQHSGVMDSLKDRLELPRFPINENWGKADRFAEVLNSKPLPVLEILPEDKRVTKFRNPPEIELVLASGIQAGRISCFTHHGDEWYAAAVSVRSQDRVHVQVLKPYITRTGRVNCSYKDTDGQFRWLGMQFVLPHIASDK